MPDTVTTDGEKMSKSVFHICDGAGTDTAKIVVPYSVDKNATGVLLWKDGKADGAKVLWASTPSGAKSLKEGTIVLLFDVEWIIGWQCGPGCNHTR